MDSPCPLDFAGSSSAACPVLYSSIGIIGHWIEVPSHFHQYIISFARILYPLSKREGCRSVVERIDGINGHYIATKHTSKIETTEYNICIIVSPHNLCYD